mmetsp:Transcript_31629/g.58118  ORF Transcript_31629/g.58118 Transcript_31629/m.58118 type:complete len:155 (+) Transcript_31629:78-542(+)
MADSAKVRAEEILKDFGVEIEDVDDETFRAMKARFKDRKYEKGLAYIEKAKPPDTEGGILGISYGIVGMAGGEYDGAWKDGLRHGKGRFTEANGNRYDGEWKENKMHGQGIYTTAKGGRMEGTWKEGLKHGWFHLTSASGGKSRRKYEHDEWKW